MKEAIILAGGFGTRLREVLPNLPKCLAPIQGRPILGLIIDFLIASGVDRIIFSLYYKSDHVISYLNENFSYLDYDFVVDDAPLGTGGALRHAFALTNVEDVLVLNGDTIFKIDITDLYNFHNEVQAHFTIALKNLLNPDRYGTVSLDQSGRIYSFKEKNSTLIEGLINGGIYLVNKVAFRGIGLAGPFSLENDYFGVETENKRVFGRIYQEYFIDIGVPKDYHKANLEL